MPIDWSHDYGFDGWMGYRDAENERSYILGAEDGTLQAVLNEDGTITAAGGNIVLGRDGMLVHDLSDASIITPAFGVGWIHDTISSSEDFTAWTMGGTASVTGNTQQAPSGQAATADTVTLPASGDHVTKQAIASPTLANGQSAVFMVYLKAAGAGTIRLQAGTSAGGAELGALDFNVLDTNWRRAALVYTNSTGGAVRPYVTIKRNSAGQLASVYAWGAQMAYDVDKEVPYYFFNPDTGKKWGVSIRSPLFITNETTGSVLIGNNWSTIPSGIYGVFVGSGSGNGNTSNNLALFGSGSGYNSSGNSMAGFGYNVLYENTANNVVAVGHNAGYQNTGANLSVLGTSAGGGNSGQFLAAVGDAAGYNNSGDYVVALGRNSGQNNTGGEVIFLGGCGISNTHEKLVLFGNAETVATADQQIVFGSDTLEYLELYGGGGVVQASPPNFAINATGGSGTNVAGGALTLAGGKGTGSGAGGSLLFKTAAAGGSGSSLNSLATAFEITGEGTLDFKNSPVVNFSGGGGGSVNRWRLMFGA